MALSKHNRLDVFDPSIILDLWLETHKILEINNLTPCKINFILLVWK
jgi:hypothetical protein